MALPEEFARSFHFANAVKFDFLWLLIVVGVKSQVLWSVSFGGGCYTRGDVVGIPVFDQSFPHHDQEKDEYNEPHDQPECFSGCGFFDLVFLWVLFGFGVQNLASGTFPVSILTQFKNGLH